MPNYHLIVSICELLNGQPESCNYAYTLRDENERPAVFATDIDCKRAAVDHRRELRHAMQDLHMGDIPQVRAAYRAAQDD